VRCRLSNFGANQRDRPRLTQALIVRVDEAVYNRSCQVARQWDCRHEFSLFSRDCVEFLRAVACRSAWRCRGAG
jgi:hypothetical protein